MTENLRTRIAAALKDVLGEQVYTVILNAREPFSMIVDGEVDLLDTADAVIEAIALKREQLSGGDIRRIADALETMVNNNRPSTSDELLAMVHENYADAIKTIFESGENLFETAKMIRSLELRARQTAIQLRNK